MPAIEIEAIPDFLKGFEVEEDGTFTGPVDKSTDNTEVIKEDSLDNLKKELEIQDNPVVEDTKVDEPVADKTERPVENIEESPSVKVFLDAMIESNILSVPEGTELEDTPEALVEAFEHTVSSKVQDGIDRYKEDIPELGKQFLEYIEKGGDPKKFIEAQNDPLDLQALDLTNEDDQKAVIEELLINQCYDADEIKETLQDYEDGLLLEKQSKIAVKKLEKAYEANRQNLMAEQDKVVKQREKEANDYISTVQTTINSATEIAGLAVSDKDKKDFESYLLRRDKDGYTQYQKDINNDPLNTQLKLAYLAFKKYDFSGVAKQAESTAAKKLRDAINQKKETTVKGQSQEPKVTGSDFSGFNKFAQNMKKN